MRNKTLKSAALAVVAGGMVLGGGCLSLDGFLGKSLIGVAYAVAADFVFDGGVIDLFPETDYNLDGDEDPSTNP